jgi:hypothetical protein
VPGVSEHEQTRWQVDLDLSVVAERADGLVHHAV